MNLHKVVDELGAYVEAASRGRNPSRRKTAAEGLCDIVPADDADIVFGQAFAEWSGAKLSWLVENVPVRTLGLFVAISARRLRDLRTNCAKMQDELDADAIWGALLLAKARKAPCQKEIEKVISENADFVSRLIC